MILVDMNQFIISAVMVALKNDEFNETYLRYNLIKSLKEYEETYRGYGDMVLAFDSKNYWRKNFFEFYKQNRKKERKKSDVDWDYVHSLLRQFKAEFEKSLKYIVLEICGCEADDIIAIIATKLSQKSIVISDDKDFLQLLKFENVSIYRPRKQEFLTFERGNEKIIQDNLVEHIIRGDRSDGIPNVLSFDNSLADGIRQKPITKKFLSNILDSDVKEDVDFYDKYLRNKTLIDLTEIPQSIERLVLTELKLAIQTQNRTNRPEYFSDHNMTSLLNQ